MRILLEKMPVYNREKKINSSEAVYSAFKEFTTETRETFFCIYIDNKNAVIETEVLSLGCVSSAAIYPRQLVRAAVLNNCSSVICLHNHPSGDPRPSANDERITRTLFAALELIQVKLLDHLILGINSYYSFADSGRMQEIEITVQRYKRENGIE